MIYFELMHDLIINQHELLTRINLRSNESTTLKSFPHNKKLTLTDFNLIPHKQQVRFRRGESVVFKVYNNGQPEE